MRKSSFFRQELKTINFFIKGKIFLNTKSLGEDEDPEPTKKLMRDGMDFDAFEVHRRIDTS